MGKFMKNTNFVFRYFSWNAYAYIITQNLLTLKENILGELTIFNVKYLDFPYKQYIIALPLVNISNILEFIISKLWQQHQAIYLNN